MYAPIVILLIDRPDLLNPGSIPQARVELIDDSTVVTDLGGLYKDGAEGDPNRDNIGRTEGEIERHRTKFKVLPAQVSKTCRRKSPFTGLESHSGISCHSL